MPPSLALCLWFILLVALLRFDPARDSKVSFAVWVPVMWMFIVGSRLPSQWLGGQVAQVAQVLEEGNPLDRTVDLVLILLALAILVSRSFKWGGFISRNLALTALLSFALVSLCWSDFPFVALKRWFRDLGNYLVVLVVLSDPRPLEAVRSVLRRLSYLLIPLSILLIKYYPQLGKQWETWTGADSYVGATTSKNMLGLVCLVSGLFFCWDTVTRWPERKQRRTKRIILVNFAFIALTLWVLNLAHSATSSVCLVLGCLVIAAVNSKVFQRHPGFLKALIPACFCAYLILAFGFNINGELAGAVGRDPTLTGRADIWKILLSMHTNPLVGTGYESFWLGSRLQWFWQNSGYGHLNEAHNGYLQVYLNLGLIGVLLLVGFLIASYRNICKTLNSSSSLASLALATWAVLVFYNMTEAAFMGGLLWLMVLMSTVSLAERVTNRVQRIAAFDNPDTVATFPLETAGVHTGRAVQPMLSSLPNRFR
jgi:exopolysaccharide production protein ExoQ